MSRSGYSEDVDDNWDHIRWRGQVASAIKGKRGQRMLREMLGAREVVYENDDVGWGETDEARWLRMREWVVQNLRDDRKAAAS